MSTSAYFERIGYRDTPAVDLSTLATLLDLHMTSIPFENLDVLLGQSPKLDIASLFDKLVGARRGGYCYEHATLFGSVLDTLGFTVHRHSARVTGQRAKSESPRTHMFLTVELPTGAVVVDPGFGATVPRVPLSLDGTPAGDFHLARDGREVALIANGTAAWVSTLDPEYPIDFEMANHFTSTSTLSPFTRVLMMRVFTPEGRITIRNRTLTKFPSGETSIIATGAELRAACREHFGFDLPALDALVVPA